MRRAVFVDRDGVLNRVAVRDGRPHPPAGPNEVEVLPGVVESCAMLRGAGFLVIVVTNQPDVARGTQRRETVEVIHDLMRSRIPLDDIRVCYHDDADACACRKPKPGMLLQAARDWSIDLARSVMVGDRWRDVEAGRRAGCATVFIDNGYAEPRPESVDFVTDSLWAAGQWIVDRRFAPGEGDDENIG